MALEFSAATKLLFIGDSVTDSGHRDDPERIGHGYVRLIRDYLRTRIPASAPNVINRGISGEKVTNLADRWQRDVLDLAPDVLSIQIGASDVVKNLAGRSEGTPLERYTRVYDNLLAQVTTLLPDCRLVLCEPTPIWPPQPVQANEQLQLYLAALRELALKHNAASFVPLHGAFENAKAVRAEVDWMPDGLHPSSAGHMLIALTWLDAADGAL
jgi:acyl-CoA thioesterase-1